MSAPARLVDLQDAFQSYLLNETDGAAIHQRVVDDARVGARQRLRIYHDAYRLRLIEALSEAYPNLGKLLGDDLFDRLAGSYIAAHPSVYRNLRWYGGDLADHLAGELPQHPIACELARFEWTLALAFDSKDSAILDNEALAAMPAEEWSGLQFVLHPSVHLLEFKLNTPAVWKSLDQDEAPPAIGQTPASWLIWRKEFSPHFRSLEAYERASLAFIQKGASFADICEALAQDASDDDAIAMAARYLSTWLNDGVLAGFRHTPDDKS
jgi:hypothetical protein